MHSVSNSNNFAKWSPSIASHCSHHSGNFFHSWEHSLALLKEELLGLSMTQTWLNHIMVLHVCKHTTDCIDLDDIVKEFIQVNERRIILVLYNSLFFACVSIVVKYVSAWCKSIDSEMHEDTKRDLPDSKKSCRQQKLSTLRAGHTDQLLRDSSYFCLYHRSLYNSKKHEGAWEAILVTEKWRLKIFFTLHTDWLALHTSMPLMDNTY